MKKAIRTISRPEIAYPIAFVLSQSGMYADNFVVYLTCVSLSIFLIIFSSIVLTPAVAKGTFDHVPLPREVRTTVRHEHRHEHYEFSQCDEGKEISEKLPDGRVITVRHVRRWK